MPSSHSRSIFLTGSTGFIGGALLERLSAIDVPAWAERCARRGVIFSPGEWFHFAAGGKQCLRVGFARADEGELRNGIRTLAQCWPKDTRQKRRLPAR